MRGREVEARSAIQTAIVDAEETFQGLVVKIVQAWAALMCNALGRYEEALDFAQQSCADPINFGIYQALPELVEAAVRSGQLDAAHRGLLRLVESTRTSGTDWALGVEARTRALLSTGEEAEALYVESIRRFADTPLQFDEARTHLLYGEWLRREGRRVDARSHLHTAFDALREMGSEAFAERARVELEATGEKVRKRSPETRLTLTPQEAQIARLASAGQTNPEIGARLFLSSRTVEYHLRKVFMKLEVKSRRQLPEALGRAEQALATA
jgi:DNA-binding CsgD family transcriptional regulator